MNFFSYNIASINTNTISNSTKINALQTFVRLLDLDIILLQEVENNQLSIPGYNIICNIDHNRRGTAIALKQYIRFSHVEKSLDSRLISLRINDSVTICNIYAPSGVQFRNQREYLFSNTLPYYVRQATEYLIIGGDFNSVIEARDATGESNFSGALQNTIQHLQMIDVWSSLGRGRNGYTYITHNSASRIDRLYVSRNLRSQLRESDAHAVSFTDHKALSVRLCLPQLGRQHGKGFWSIRPHILTEDNLEEFDHKWTYWTRQRRNYASWMEWWIRYVKPKILSFFRWKSREKYIEFQQQQQNLYVQLREAYDGYYGNPAMITTINRLKGQMLLLQRNFTKTFIRINENCFSGEPISAFQLGERKRKKTTIERLTTSENGVLDDSDNIQQHVVGYFRDLFSQHDIDEENQYNCNRVIPEDSQPNRECMDEITTGEIFSVLKTSSKRKSPGADGIPVEFYIKTFDTIHRHLNLVMNEALLGNFPSEFVEGVIVLVKKKGNDTSIKGYRPISLLNHDYKLLSRLLKARLDRIMQDHSVLSPVQKCSNGKKNIFQATLSIKDRIARFKAERKYGKVISFDLDHAFDRVDRRFLFRTMENLGFNVRLINLLTKIGQLSTSKIMINGHLSSSFPIERSVRQGDPIAMHLFVIYLHPLISHLQSICDGPDDMVVAYADDITIITTCVSKVERVKSAFNLFELQAGAKLNLCKTFSIDIGQISPRNRLQVNWLNTVEKVRILGIVYVNSVRLMTKLNWDSLVSHFALQLRNHRARILTLDQKIKLLNTYVSSKIWYVASIVTLSNTHIAKITSLMGCFIWSGYTTRVPIQQLALPIEEGGLKLQLPVFKCKSLLINRHLQEADSMSFFSAFLNRENPPNLQILPSNCPCMKLICQEYAYLPSSTLDNLSAGSLHQFFLSKADRPKVVQNEPNLNWRMIWRNIRKLNSYERSMFYLLVNRKLPHQELLYRMQRVTSPLCPNCNRASEDLEHKFATCPRVSTAWSVLQYKLQMIVPNRVFNFSNILQPTLQGIRNSDRIKLLKSCIQYVIFVNSSNNVIDIDALDFHLDTEI